MKIPSTDEFRPLVLRVLHTGEPMAFAEICERAASLAGLDEQARAQTLPSGGKRYVNRINWACSSFYNAGLVTRPKRGVYRITDDGRAVDARNLESYTEKDMLEWEAWRAYKQEVAERNNTKQASISEASVIPESSHGTLETIEELASNFNAEVETTLRRRLQEATPEFFEKAVIDLLWAMGYGGAHGDKQRIGQSGDGGIDGIIRQDPLGLTTVYIQAKRYADNNAVGTPQIRDFMGALDSKGAALGVFITTSRFAPKAIELARAYRHGTIVLIDGVKLTALMLDYGVAVSEHKTFTLYSIDEDFFTSESD